MITKHLCSARHHEKLKAVPGPPRIPQSNEENEPGTQAKSPVGERWGWVGGVGVGLKKPGENERRGQPMFAYVVNKAMFAYVVNKARNGK